MGISVGFAAALTVPSVPQRIRRLKEKLEDKCLVWMEVDDEGANYAELLSLLTEIRDAIKPHKFPRGRARRRASELKEILTGLVSSSKAHALKKMPGLAKTLYAEISGQAGSKVYTRFNAALAAAGAAVSARAGSGASGRGGSSASSDGNSSRNGRASGRGGLARGRGYGRPADGGKCWNCFEPGHFSSKCPKPRGAANKE